MCVCVCVCVYERNGFKMLMFHPIMYFVLLTSIHMFTLIFMNSVMTSNCYVFTFRKGTDLLQKVKGKRSIELIQMDDNDDVKTAKKMKASLDEELRQVFLLNDSYL